MNKRQRWKIGSVVKIPLDNDYWSYAILHNLPDVSFLNIFTNQELQIENIQQANALFNVGVSEYIVKTGDWPIVGSIDLDSNFTTEEPMRFVQDGISGELFLYHSQFADQGYMKSCGIEDIDGLEKAAAWDRDHIKDRLQAQFTGSVDRWAETMKVDKEAYARFKRRKLDG